MASDNTISTLDITLGNKVHPSNMGNVMTDNPQPVLAREPDPIDDNTPLLSSSVQESLLDICSSISATVDHLGLEEVARHTIEYVDNNNKSVLLVNKHLLSIGKTPIPVIAPGLAPHYLTEESISEAKQGSVLLFTMDGENASLGILMSTREVEGESLYKTLTTEGDIVVVIHLKPEQVKLSMR